MLTNELTHVFPPRYPLVLDGEPEAIRYTATRLDAVIDNLYATIELLGQRLERLEQRVADLEPPPPSRR